jgi:hypothetical protein
MDGAILPRRNSALFSLDRNQSLVMWSPSGQRPHLLDANMHTRACITAHIVTKLLPYTDASCRPPAPLRMHEYFTAYAPICAHLSFGSDYIIIEQCGYTALPCYITLGPLNMCFFLIDISWVCKPHVRRIYSRQKSDADA